jgi:DNA-binding CsgD family transcriptional regulator
LARQSEEILPNRELSLGLDAEINLDINDVEATRRLIDDLSDDPNATIHISARLIRAAYETSNNEYLNIGESILNSKDGRANGLQRFWIEHYSAIAAALKHDTASAAEHYSALTQDRDTILYPSPFSGDHVLALLAKVMGNLDAASTHFEDALTFCRKANYRPELAWICHDYADMLRERNESGDISKARELVDEAGQIASDLGMKPLGEKVTALKERLDARPAPKREYPDGLTEREVEVLRLVASGMTDREIAGELFIAIRTASTHVRNILSKTDSANRTEAASYATRHGLA